MKNLFLNGRTTLPSLVGVAGVIILLVLSLANEYQEAEKHAQSEVETLSRVLEEHALATVQKVDLALLDVQRHARPDDMRLRHGAIGPRSGELHVLLKSHRDNVPEVSLLHLINAHGEHIHSSLATLPAVNLSDRPYFQRQRDDAAAGLVISSPIISRVTGKWTLILCRRISFKDGSFAGTVQASLDMEYFQEFYRSLNLDNHDLVALFDKDLSLAVRYPPSEKNMGKISNLNAKEYIEKGIVHATYHAKSVLDGIDRIYSFRQVGNLPLFVFAGIAEEDYLAEWRQHVWQYGIGIVVFSMVVIGFVVRQRRAEAAISRLNAELEQRVAQRTAELETAIFDLENFNYSASHDLRIPLRAVDGFSKILIDEYAQQLDEEGKRLLNVVRDNSKKMAQLIDDMLAFSRTGRMTVTPSEINMGELVHEVMEELKPATAGRDLKLVIGTMPSIFADRHMMRRVMANLLSNAVKFTRPKASALIEVGAKTEGTETVFYVKDNGAGFDMKYAGKLFGVFQRLHGVDEFEGAGIGLAVVKRIVAKHGGRVWAEGTVNEGATFYFAIPAIAVMQKG